jgi:hypothetical protein
MTVHKTVQGIFSLLYWVQNDEMLLQQIPRAFQKQTGILRDGNQTGDPTRMPLLLFESPKKLYPYAIVVSCEGDGDGMPFGVNREEGMPALTEPMGGDPVLGI